ncbi:MAG: type ISP restriction/modification enzyme [bacterium]
MIDNYLKKLSEQYASGDSREESFYDSLKQLIVEHSETKRKKIHVTILPKKTDAGNPDFKISDNHNRVIGYIEAKTIGADLDKFEHTDQLQRYINTFPNVILTNFTDFRLYRDGKFVDKVFIARSMIIKKLETVPPSENVSEFFELLERFLSYSIPKSFNAKSLAVELAKRTRFLKDQVIAEELRSGDKNLIGFHAAFKEFLIAGIDEEEFADLYSQTITYGLFAARLRADKAFNRRLAFDFIPKTIGILRDIFRFISGTDLPEQMQSIVDDISDVLDVADTKKILEDYFVQGKGSDPVLHFYETFLEIYDPVTREKRGVYYTPEPVVSFIVRSLHIILKEKFGMTDGLANSGVTLLDPAGGTLSFLAEAIKIAVKELEERIGKGIIPPLIKEHILENYYAFELMMAPYAIGHMKMSFLLEELGYKMNDTERVKYYLTNTLDMEELEESKFPTMSSLSHESHAAGIVKREEPILVILGNPPYSINSANTGEWISKEIRTYYEVDGEPLGERNPKALQDDYVKFIRFAQWKIDKAGSGVLGFITNHSYLDNPTFRGMRKSLMNSFDEIHILDLHGNSLKKEKSPDGSKDENVFDIQQGVAIALFIKESRDHKINKVFHHELFGLREKKYSWLEKNDYHAKQFKQVYPAVPWYLFKKGSAKKLNYYQQWISLPDIFPINSTGIKTHRDDFVIAFEKKELIGRLNQLKAAMYDDDFLKKQYKLEDNGDWNFHDARERFFKDGDWKERIIDVHYKPFDFRKIFFADYMINRPRFEVMKHVLKKNISLCFMRQYSGNDMYSHALVSDFIVDNRIFFSSKGTVQFAPLYIYLDETPKRKGTFTQLIMFEPEISYQAMRPNINPEVIEMLEKQYKMPFHFPVDKEKTKGFCPEDIFYYIYAVLYSNLYRTKFIDFLRIDFPRIPFTKDFKLFIKLAKIGQRLAELHLLKSNELIKTKTKFPIVSSNKVEKPKFENDTVWINSEQYFTKISEEVWHFQVGGYHVCDKWLKDRKGRLLTKEEIDIYCKIVTSLSLTIEIQKEIDKFISDILN